VNIVVCVKPVPDVSIITLRQDTIELDSEDLVYAVNPCDVVAVEAAVRIKESVNNSRVTLVSLAPPTTKGLLRHCLALGADEALLLWDSAFAALDSYATGVILARAIGSLEYDLILCGDRAIDTEEGQVGSVIAERLDIPLVNRVAKIDVDACDKKVTVERKLDKGNREKIEAILPALLTVDMALNEPRYPGLPSLMAGLRQEIKEYDLNALGLTEEEIESKTRVVAFSLPKPRPKKPFTPDSNLPAAERMRLIMSGGITQKQGNLLQGDLDYIASSVVQFLIEQKLLT